MTTITTTVKFDQELWNARSEGFHADGAQNPYIYSSPMWAAWEAGRAFGPGRVANARGCAMNVETKHGNYRMTFDELQAAPDYVIRVTYAF